MENQISLDDKQNKIALKQELENKVNVWVDRTFNFIQVAVLEKYTDNCLFEYIRNTSIEEIFYDWLCDCNSSEKIISWMNDVEIENDLVAYHEYKGSLKESFVFVFGSFIFLHGLSSLFWLYLLYSSSSFKICDNCSVIFFEFNFFKSVS